MTEILHQASDDQLALAICFGAVLVSGLIMHFSHHVGRLTGRVRLHDGREQPDPVSANGRRTVPHLSIESNVRDRAA